MKKTYSSLLIIFLVTLLVACKKDKGEDASDHLKGTWELAESSSSWFPLKTDDPGNGNQLEINGDTYAYYKNGQVIEQGNYTTVADSSVEPNVMLINLKDKYKTRIDFTNVTPSRTVFKTFFYIEDDKLYIVSGNYALDSGSKTVYRRSHAVTVD